MDGMVKEENARVLEKGLELLHANDLRFETKLRLFSDDIIGRFRSSTCVNW